MFYVTLICLLYMLAIVAVVIVRLCRSSRKERLTRLKSFKRGKFVFIYAAMIPLYYLAYRYNGVSVEGSLLQCIATGIETVVLKFPYSTLSALMNANLFYHITVIFGFVLVILNALAFTASLCGQLVVNAVSLLITRCLRKKVVVVVGYNQGSLDIIKSIDKSMGKAVLAHKHSREAQDDAFILRADYLSFDGENLGKTVSRLFRKFDKRKVYVILNCEDDAENLLYVKQLGEIIESANLTSLPLTDDCGLQVFAFGKKDNESIFMRYVEQTKGLVKYVNRHEQIAVDFAQRYPMTQFMTEREIDFDTATIKDSVNLNFFMIGFGNLNESLFLTSVSNDRFLTLKNGKLTPKPVSYYIYDRNYPSGKLTDTDEEIYSRSLNHGYGRYKRFLELNSGKKSEYLEFIPEPADVHVNPCDVASPKFYSSMYDVLKNENSYSYVIVSFGSDMENIELAEKLMQKFRDWNITSVVKLFVKVRDDKLFKGDFENGDLHLFGSSRSCVYNAAAILSEKTERMARLRHLLYIAEDAQKASPDRTVSLSENELSDLARDKWYGFKQFQRESNLYACLSIRTKLHLAGYDIAEDGDDLSSEFEAKYEAGDKRTPSPLTVDGKTIWAYSNAEQGSQSLRWTYAVTEHARWCANMICSGVVPSDKEEIKRSGGKVLSKRLHGNLTTMDGLVEYRKLIAEATGSTEEQTDVIRYDYQLMDDAVWLLRKCGYKIVKKK